MVMSVLGFKARLDPTVADPGFPRGGGANSQGGVPGYNFIKISRKLHEIKENSAPRGGRGGRTSPAPPLDPPLSNNQNTFLSKIILYPVSGRAEPH